MAFFQTLERVDKSRKTNWLSDHPAPPDHQRHEQAVDHGGDGQNADRPSPHSQLRTHRVPVFGPDSVNL